MLRTTLHDQRAKLRQVPVLLTCLGMSVYFAYHTLHGRHGLETRTRLIERSSLLEFEVKSLETERAGLERDIALLSPDLPDADIVEETARGVLGFARPGERIATLSAPVAGR